MATAHWPPTPTIYQCFIHMGEKGNHTPTPFSLDSFLQYKQLKHISPPNPNCMVSAIINET